MTKFVSDGVTQYPVEARQCLPAHDFDAIRIYGGLDAPVGTGQCAPKRLRGQTAGCMGEDRRRYVC